MLARKQSAKGTVTIISKHCSVPAAPSARLWGELLLDEQGGAHFICHTKDDDFAATKHAFEKFIALLQRQITNEKECPFYEADAPLNPESSAGTLTENSQRQCAWTYDPDGYWQTSCGDQFQISGGTPAENNMRFCHYCGLRITEESK